MRSELFKHLESAIAARNPGLAQRLQSGLAEDTIRQLLSEVRITPPPQLIALYSWKNGTISDEFTPLDDTAFLPETLYQFLPLQMAISQLPDMQSGAAFHPILADKIAHYFPMFWDHSTGFVVLDLNDREGYRVMRMDFEDVDGVREAYPSFDAFINEAIRVWAEPLSC